MEIITEVSNKPMVKVAEADETLPLDIQFLDIYLLVMGRPILHVFYLCMDVCQFYQKYDQDKIH